VHFFGSFLDSYNFFLPLFFGLFWGRNLGLGFGARFRVWISVEREQEQEEKEDHD